MADATMMFIQTILENKDMESKLRKFFERFFRDVEEAANRLPVYLQVIVLVLYSNTVVLHCIVLYVMLCINLDLHYRQAVCVHFR